MFGVWGDEGLGGDRSSLVHLIRAFRGKSQLLCVSGPRAASLTTLAILNSAKKALEGMSKRGTKSVGGSASSEAPSTAGSQQGGSCCTCSGSAFPARVWSAFQILTAALLFPVSFQSLNRQSSGENVAVAGRAISTPERE